MKIKALVLGMAAAVLSTGLISTVAAQDSEVSVMPAGVQVFGQRRAEGAAMHPFGQQVRQFTPGQYAARPGRGRGNPERALERMDTNADGNVDDGEFVAARTRHVEDTFSRRDADNDGLLSREELQRRERADRPEIDRAEVIACVREFIADYDPESHLEDRFDAVDTNDDGYIDQLELSTALQARAYKLFDRLDTDNDGFISLDEIEQGHDLALNLRRIIRDCIDQLADPLDADLDL